MHLSDNGQIVHGPRGVVSWSPRTGGGHHENAFQKNSRPKMKLGTSDSELSKTVIRRSLGSPDPKRSIVIADQVDMFSLGDGLVDQAEKSQPLLMPVPLLASLIPSSRAMVRVDQWVRLAGVVCMVLLITVLTIAAGIHGVRLGRGASLNRPSTPP
jgi:hypothetical protein